MKTVFITGASTGIGYECAKLFMDNGWNVVATMRNPENAPDALKQENVLITKMDVTDNDSIKKAIQEAIDLMRDQINKHVLECLELTDDNPIDPYGAGEFLPEIKADLV